ncbi:MAG: hypothetical protein L3J44_03010 [Campylobacteraceae bacterium]|nr:hypothetical protein [Campylobacteraceae bacterium]
MNLEFSSDFFIAFLALFWAQYFCRQFNLPIVNKLDIYQENSSKNMLGWSIISFSNKIRGENSMKKSYLFLVLLFSFTSLYASAKNGASLFQGTQYFKNGATACIACHSVSSNLVESGGKLAINLTTMGGDGVAYTILKPQNASSAIMRQAYKGKALTSNEQSDLSDFFNKVANDNIKNSKFTSSFIVGGVIGTVILFLLLSLLGKNRKKESVNKDIYDRQLKTSWRN